MHYQFFSQSINWLENLNKIKMGNNGFSLLEILLVAAIISILTAVGFGIYSNFTLGVELETSAQSIIADLKSSRSKAMFGEDGLRWGIHFVNGQSDYYEIFSTPDNYLSASSTVKTSNYLPSAVIFENPAEASSKDIIFNRISGEISSSTTISISFGGSTRTITVTLVGNIY